MGVTVRLFLVVGLSLGLLGATSAAQAQSDSQESLGITPAALDVQNAQRGERYWREVVVQNEFDSPTTMRVETLDRVGSWMSTDPSSGFEVPPRSHKIVVVQVEVPTDAPNGLHQGVLRLVADTKGSPTGTGLALRYALSIPVNVTVGGEQVMDVRWREASVADVEVGTPVEVRVDVSNHGNVRGTARGSAQVLDLAGNPVRSAVAGEVELLPGQAGALWLPVGDALPEGQYRVRVQSEEGHFERLLDLHVLPPGSLVKKGNLRYIEHEPWVQAGLPVRVAAVFENTGDASLGRARFVGEVYLDDRLVGVLESDPRFVPVGEQVELVAFFTPQQAGQYRIVGTVRYDGFEALPSEGILNVASSAEAEGVPAWVGPAVVAAAAGAGGALFLARRP